jgi:hypothetical protein
MVLTLEEVRNCANNGADQAPIDDRREGDADQDRSPDAPQLETAELVDLMIAQHIVQVQSVSTGDSKNYCGE